jgi:hypothetical protein
MNGSPISLPASERNQQSSMTDALPHWEQLPATQQREMVLTLAVMLTRQLPTHLEQQEVRYESAS